MRNLKSKLFGLLIIVGAVGCQTYKTFHLKSFKQLNASDLHIIQVKASLVQQKCLYFNAEADNNWRHQYFIYVRNDKNEFFEIMHPTHQDKETCDLQVKKIEKILKTGSEVSLCARGEIRKASVNRDYLGGIIDADSSNEPLTVYQALTLDSICFSKKCFSNNSVFTTTCPGFTKN